MAVAVDFNGDGHPDWVARNVNTRQTVLVYLNDNVVVGAALGPTLAANLALTGAADFNVDTHPDYALFAPNTFQTSTLVFVRTDTHWNCFRTHFARRLGVGNDSRF